MKTDLIGEELPRTESELREEIDNNLRQIKRSMQGASPEERYYFLIRAYRELQENLPTVDPIDDPEVYARTWKRRNQLEEQYGHWLFAVSKNNPEALDRAFARIASETARENHRILPARQAIDRILRQLPCLEHYEPEWA
ncbi:MAG: hypothetical protein LUD68_06485 [Rikenellaceae bacterium]|nr:hypothetical protein [Rikenellaceae bacterium]